MTAQLIVTEIPWVCLSCGTEHVQWYDSTAVWCDGCGKILSFGASQ